MKITIVCLLRLTSTQIPPSIEDGSATRYWMSGGVRSASATGVPVAVGMGESATIPAAVVAVLSNAGSSPSTRLAGVASLAGRASAFPGSTSETTTSPDWPIALG